MKATMNAQEFKRIIECVSDFVSKENNQQYPETNWVQLNIDKDLCTIQAFAYDGYKMAISSSKIIDSDESFTCVIKKDIPQISKLCPPITIELERGQVLLKVQERLVGYLQPLMPLTDFYSVIGRHEAGKTGSQISMDSSMLKKVINSIDNNSICDINYKSETEPLSFEFLNSSGFKEYRFISPVLRKTPHEKGKEDDETRIKE